MKRPFYNAIHSLFYDQRHFVSALCVRFSFLFSDEVYLRIMHRLQLKRTLDLKNPITYNDKLQWLKLYYRRPDFTVLADKIAVKQVVAKMIGSEYVVPLLGVWNNENEIEWDKLPQKFVLKTNHDGGSFGVILCKDRNQFSVRKAKKRLKASLNRNTFLLGREWPYKNIPRKVFAEQFIDDGSGNGMPDYKFLCFDGKVKLMFIASGRESGVKMDYYDENFHHLDLTQSHPMSSVPPTKPINFDLMKILAEKLSEGIPHVRVDFFEANGRVYFSELTFFSYGGWAAFHPEEYDYELGRCLKLPSERYV